MSLLHLAYLIARRRIITAWQLELVLFLGIVLSVALLSSSVVFSDLLAETALRNALQEATPEEANFWVRVFNNLEDPVVAAQRTSTYQTGVDFVRERVTSPFEPFLEDQTHLLETATFFFSGHPQLELDTDRRPRGRLQYLNGALERGYFEMEEGRWPETHDGPETSPAGPTLEIAVEGTGAEFLQLGVGDEMLLTPATGNERETATRVRIVGIFRRVNPESDFWQGRDNNFANHNGQWATVPMFTTEATILDRIGRVYPSIYTNVTWIFDLDRRAVRAGDVDALQSIIRSVRFDVVDNLRNSTISIRLDRVLDRYSEQLLLSRIPLFLMVFLVTGILAYYLSLIAGLIIRSRGVEISILKSRGATTPQVGLLVLVEGLLLSAPAVVLGTLLAPLVARALGGIFFEVPGGPVTVGLSDRAFLLGLAGALLAVVVLTLSTLAAARKGIVEFRQSGARPTTRPFIHRYYIDLLLLGLIAFLWWQIRSRDSFLVQPLGSTGLEIDFTLLLGPVLGLLALGLVVLRFFPLLVALVAALMEPLGPAWLVQGLRRVARDPIVPGSLVVLLMLATALGVIGAAFTATLERSQRDRAIYQVGADLRLTHSGGSTPYRDYGLADRAAELGSVQQLAEAHRTSGNVLTRGFSASRVSVLAVDTDRLAEAAWYRPDFSEGTTLAGLMQAINPDPATTSGEGIAGSGDGIQLPEEATALALWVNPGRPGSRLALRARLRDATGYYFDAALGEVDAREWQRLEGPLTPVTVSRRGLAQRAQPPAVTPPFTLLSIQIFSQFGRSEPGVLFLQDLAVVTPAGERVLSDFQDRSGWQVVEDYSRPSLYALEPSEAVARPGHRQSAVFSWAPGGIGFSGLWAGPPETPIPALVNPAFLEAAEIQVGDTVNLSISTYAIPVRVVAVADFFPTLDPREQSFAVLDLARFNHYANRHNRRVAGGPNEVWASVSDDTGGLAELRQVLDQRGLTIDETRLASTEVAERTSQPLTNASWGGLLVLMFLALVLASASGVILFSYMDTRERRIEFALLRTLGASRGQLNGLVWFNLFLVVACGIGLGTWAGLQIGAIILPVLEIAEGGVRVTPPMVLETNWVTLLASYLVLAGVTGGTVIWLAWFTGKLEVQQVLRAGEAGV